MKAALSLAELAQLMQLAPPDEGPMGLWHFTLRRVAAGESLLRQGDPFRSLYVVRSGFFKTVLVRDEAEQVVAFPMAGDALGVDGISEGVHPAESMALTEAQVAVVPYALIEQMECPRGVPGQILLRLLCRESAGKSEHLALLGYRNATARAAAFLLQLRERLAKRGYASTTFFMPMRHADIGSYLCLRPETLSRAFATLNAAGPVEICLKSVAIRDVAGLQAIAAGEHQDDDEPGTRLSRGRSRRAHPPSARLLQ